MISWAVEVLHGRHVLTEGGGDQGRAGLTRDTLVGFR